MIKVLKNYTQTILLIVAIIIGGVIGLNFPKLAENLKPLGDLFINLIFVITVPLIFFSISSSIARMKQPKRLGKIMKDAIIVIAITSLVAVAIGLIGTYVYKPIEDAEILNIFETIENPTEEVESLNPLAQFVKSITVSDFSLLLSKSNMIALIVFSILFGISACLTSEKSKPMIDFLEAGNEVVMKFISIIMYYAPIGLGCYFASTIVDIGASLVVGYVRAFLWYLVVAVLYYIIVYSAYAYFAGGKKGLKDFWKNIVPPSLTALGTCSSAVSIPSNIIAAKNNGVPSDIAEMVIPLGTNIHKDGSLIGSVLKIVFLFCLFGKSMAELPVILGILFGAIAVGFLISAVPTGGGVISEMMILTMFGFPAGAIGILAIIATIIDAPATVLNVVGNNAVAIMTARTVEGKEWNK